MMHMIQFDLQKKAAAKQFLPNINKISNKITNKVVNKIAVAVRLAGRGGPNSMIEVTSCM